MNALLVAGADVHALNKWRETPLLTAANHGQAGAVDILLRAGADPCKCTDTGWSPLSIAAYKGHDEVVKLLLEEGAPTEEEDPTLSALLQAATKGLPETVELLLKHGADHTVTTKKGDTALSILVEQNLIDAAVEMVTVYNASIPRCSRDRKKVQRARLLINLRMKQLEQECKQIGDGLEDNSDDDHHDYGSNHSQGEERKHAQGIGSQSSVHSSGHKRNKNTSTESAEEKARAAEEALLLELELEESKAKKEKAEANSKRQKKKEKKERERQQKLKEEQLRREKEEQDRLEQDRQRKEMEEKERKERERKQHEQKEREQKELLEREKVLAAKRREREERQHRERQQQEREQKARMEKQKKEESLANTKSLDQRTKYSKSKKMLSNPSNGTSSNSPSVTPNRRWEKQEKTSGNSPPSSQGNARTNKQKGPSMPNIHIPDQERRTRNGPPQSTLMPRSAVPLHSEQKLGLHQYSIGSRNHLGISSSGDHFLKSSSASFTIEHPAICLFRRDKVSEMITRSIQVLAPVDGSLIKSVFYRWMVRASHDSAEFVDPIIPSWKDPEQVVVFFQRQLISESRKTGSISLSMEVLKESGASIGMYCINLARELDHFRQQIERHLPGSWTDAELGMTVAEDNRHGMESITIISWANRAQVQIPSPVFVQLNERFIGPRVRFLAACFMAKMWYDTKSIITRDTTMDYGLLLKTKQCAQSLAKISSELFSDPFSVGAGSAFWGTFEAVDRIFGGYKTFLKDPVGDICTQVQGLNLAFLPLDPPVAAKYTQHMVDILTCHGASNIPISFFVVAHSSCFHDIGCGPSVSDLHHLDPRLLRENRSLVRTIECLPGGRHTLFSCNGAGYSEVCNTPSLLFVLQNSCARVMSDLSDASISNLIGTIMLPLDFQNDFARPGAEVPPSFFQGLSSNSVNQATTSSEYGPIGASTFSQTFSPHDTNAIPSRRGRLFELVDNGEEEVDDDIVAGVLENLGVGLFQDNHVSAEVDIEAISLMGFREMANTGLSNQSPNDSTFAKY